MVSPFCSMPQAEVRYFAYSLAFLAAAYLPARPPVCLPVLVWLDGWLAGSALDYLADWLVMFALVCW